MKILCMIDGLGMGGAQRQLVTLAIGFKNCGHDVSFLIYHNRRFFDSLLSDHDIDVHCIEGENYLHRILLIRRYIRKGNFDSVLAFLEGSCFIAEIAGFPHRKWRLIVGERNADPTLLKSFKRCLYRWFHIMADFVVSNSHANIELVKLVNPLLRASKCKVIYNIVDVDYWSSIARKTDRSSGSKFRIIIAAVLSPKKNLEGLVEAVNLLDFKDKERVEFHWYGMKSYSKDFPSVSASIEKIKTLDLGKIITLFPGSKDIASIIGSSDAVGLFSYYEGLPNSICEGMALGKPVICSAVSDMPILLSDEPQLLSDPNDPDSIKKSIVYLLNLEDEKLKSIGDANLAIAKKYFSSKENIQQYLELLGNDS